MMAGQFHIPVMLSEVLAWLMPQSGRCYIDATIGGGGHAKELLARTSPDGMLLGIDRDVEALSEAKHALRVFGERAVFIHAAFDDIAAVAAREGFEVIDGVLADLGVSSHQVDVGARGFSFMRDGPLDMRMDSSSGETAATLLGRITEKELADIIFTYGEDRHARRIARHLCKVRKVKPIVTTTQLATEVERVVPRRGRIHPATRTFQALRMAINDELGTLERFLRSAPKLLADGGRLVMISYHSLEDRAIKNSFRAMAREGVGKVLTKKVITPSRDEVRINPRARSAKLRAFERVT